eukprot:4510361-Pyramimonas_sp.AAC.1
MFGGVAQHRAQQVVVVDANKHGQNRQLHHHDIAVVVFCCRPNSRLFELIVEVIGGLGVRRVGPVSPLVSMRQVEALHPH